jgi:hypothetical protein
MFPSRIDRQLGTHSNLQTVLGKSAASCDVKRFPYSPTSCVNEDQENAGNNCKKFNTYQVKIHNADCFQVYNVYELHWG